MDTSLHVSSFCLSDATACDEISPPPFISCDPTLEVTQASWERGGRCSLNSGVQGTCIVHFQASTRPAFHLVTLLENEGDVIQLE